MSAPSTRTPGIPYAAARSAIVGTANSFAFGVEYANWLLLTTHTTGRRMTADVLIASCQRPFDVAPSPQIAIATRRSPLRWYANAAPQATGYAIGRWDITAYV